MSRSHSPQLLCAALLAACAPPPRAHQPAARVHLAPISVDSLAPFVARVEAARGARFARSVRACEVAPADVARLLDAEFERFAPRAELAAESRLAPGLGLTPAGADLRALLLELASSSIAGFYSPADRAFYTVTGAESAGALSKGALEAHELAHALQNQRSELLGTLPGLRGDDDHAFALSALLEGKATWVEQQDAAARRGEPLPAPAEFERRFRADIAPDGAYPFVKMRLFALEFLAEQAREVFDDRYHP